MVIMCDSAAMEKRLYKGIISCIGHHWDKRIPKYPGQEGFKGKILHSKDYKDPSLFVGSQIVLLN